MNAEKFSKKKKASSTLISYAGLLSSVFGALMLGWRSRTGRGAMENMEM
jgi:hypothetical protein